MCPRYNWFTAVRQEGDEAVNTNDVIEGVRKLPNWVKFGVPVLLVALFIWPTIYKYDREMVGGSGQFAPRSIRSEEQEQACLKDENCEPIYARTRQLRLVGNTEYETWMGNDDNSRWLSGNRIYSASGGHRVVWGMKVEEDRITMAKGSFSRLIRIEGERSGKHPELLEQEWYVFKEGEVLTEIATGKEVVPDWDLPQVRLVLEVSSQRSIEYMLEEGVYLVDADEGRIYWRFEQDLLADELAREQLAKPDQAAAEVPLVPGQISAPHPEEPSRLVLVGPLQSDSAFRKLKSGDLHLMRGQDGWMIPLQPKEAK